MLGRALDVCSSVSSDFELLLTLVESGRFNADSGNSLLALTKLELRGCWANSEVLSDFGAKIADENKDGTISEQELNNAIALLEKAKRDKHKMNQLQTFTLFGNYIADSNSSSNMY